VPGFDAIIGQERPVRILKALLHSGKVPHALLFTGITGIGKTTLAMTLAKALNCRQFEATDAAAPCDDCPNCRRIAGGHHPDVLRVEAHGGYLRIAQIRALGETLSMRPYAAAYRVVVVRDAQRMTAPAGNALLKMLEEPPRHTIIVLTAPQPSDLLPTIVSRCQHLRCRPLTHEALEQWLLSERGLSAADAIVTAAVAGGSLARAMEMAAPESAGQWRLWRDRIAGELAGAVQKRPLDRVLAFAALLAAERRQLEALLELAQSWLRDLAVVPHRPDLVIHRDAVDRLRDDARQMTMEWVLAAMEGLQALQRSLSGQASVRLALENWALSLARPRPGNAVRGGDVT